MASVVIQPRSNISAVFDRTGPRDARLQVTGNGSANIQFTLDWSDNPSTDGDAINSIQLNGMTFNSPGENGNQTRDRVFTPGNYNINFNGLIQNIDVNNARINMFDNDGGDTNAYFVRDSVNEIDPPSFTLSCSITATPVTMVGTNSFQLGWSTANATSVTINGSAVVAGGSRTENTGLQSTAGSNSPVSRTYTITACASGEGFTTTCVSESVTVFVYNDGVPNDFSVESRDNVEPNTQTAISIGQVSGIDQSINFSGGPSTSVSTNGSNWTSSLAVTNGTSLYVRVTSLPFNTDPNGLTNTGSYYVDLGPLRRFFTVTTRAPDVNETFNLSNKTDELPYPDIDTIVSPAPAQYIVSNTLGIDDIELANPDGVEIKTNNSNTEIRIKRSGASTFGSWQNTRSI